MTEKSYSVVVMPLPEEDGPGYVAYVPDLMGCMAVGDTREEAVADIADAIVEWLDEARALKRNIPAPGAFQQECRERRDKMHQAIEMQTELIKRLQQALEEADERREVRFEWDFDCLDTPHQSPRRVAAPH